MSDPDEPEPMDFGDDYEPGSRPLTRQSVALSKTVGAISRLTLNTNKFMENFNPETSARERRKLNRKLNNTTTTSAPPKRHPGILYTEKGVHIKTGEDYCDCLWAECSGCFFECPKCGSMKCGIECRAQRKYIYDTCEYEGCNITYRNPVLSHPDADTRKKKS